MEPLSAISRLLVRSSFTSLLLLVLSLLRPCVRSSCSLLSNINFLPDGPAARCVSTPRASLPDFIMRRCSPDLFSSLSILDSFFAYSVPFPSLPVHSSRVPSRLASSRLAASTHIGARISDLAYSNPSRPSILARPRPRHVHVRTPSPLPFPFALRAALSRPYTSRSPARFVRCSHRYSHPK